MNNIEENIRKEIKETLHSHYYYEKRWLNENYAINLSPGEFQQIFVDPFREAWKGIFAELKIIASSALTAVRMAFTLNQKKAQEIWARQKDREKQFRQESDEAMAALGPAGADFDSLMFVLNPGPWMAKKIGSGAAGFVNFAKEIGVSDKSIATQKGEESEEDALIRRREQDGPVKKALRALEQIFFLAHSAPSGPILSEAAGSTELSDDIMSGPLGSVIKQQQEMLVDDITGLVELINSIAPQNAFLATIAQIETANNPEAGLQEMEKALSRFAAENPEGAKEFEKLPSEIKQEAQKLSTDASFKQEVDERNDGSSDKEPDYEKEALKAVMGASFADNIKDYMKAILENNELLEETFQAIFGKKEIDSETLETVDGLVKDFSSTIRLAERILERRLVT